jgi:uncharacterized protein YjiS (DUF1127 family)
MSRPMVIPFPHAGSPKRTAQRPAWAEWAAKLGALLRSGFTAVARWFYLRSAVHRVSQLDDRLLRDIGLSRTTLERAIRGGH